MVNLNVLANVADVDVNDVHTVVGAAAGAGPATPGTGVFPAILVGTYGDLTISATGEATYTLRNVDATVQALAAGDTEQDAFTFLVSDGHGSPMQATVTFNVHGTNDAPVAVADLGGPYAADDEDTTVTGRRAAPTTPTWTMCTVTAVSKIYGVARRSA